jgi:hypothetical protein
VKNWVAEILTFSDLNAEFNSILNNSISLISPLTGDLDIDGKILTLDAAAVTQVVSSAAVSWNFTSGAKAGTPATTGSITNFSAATFTDSATAGSGTATAYVAHALQRPTLAATNASVTTTDAATFYIANSPAAGTNETITSAWAVWVDDGAVRLDLTKTVVSAASAVLRALYLPASTETISGSTNITTATGFNFVEIGIPTLSAASALTVTNAATVYIAGAPATGGAGPSAITNAYAIWVDAGNVRFDGDLTITTLSASGLVSPNAGVTIKGDATVAGANQMTLVLAASSSRIFAYGSAGGAANRGTFQVVGVDSAGANTSTYLSVDVNGNTAIAGNIYISDTSNANATLGLTINQGAADDEIFALKSSDVAHGITSVAETDTYGRMLKHSALEGALLIDGLGENLVGLRLRGTVINQDGTHSAIGTGCVIIEGVVKSGTDVAGLSADINILAVRSNTTTKFILDSDGDSHQDVGTAWTNFDDHQDVDLLTALSVHVSRDDDPIKRGFGEFLSFNRGRLEELRLVKFNDDGHHFVNMSKLTMLLTGAVRQIAEKVSLIERRYLTTSQE